MPLVNARNTARGTILRLFHDPRYGNRDDSHPYTNVWNFILFYLFQKPLQKLTLFKIFQR